MNNKEQLPTIKQVKQVTKKKQKDQVKQVHHSNLEARLKQLDQYKQIHKQDNPGENTPQDKGEMEKEKIRQVNIVVMIVTRLSFISCIR